MFSLKSKKILFVGAVGYLTTPIIWKMAELGADVFLADCNEELGRKTAGEMSDKYPTQRFDFAWIDAKDYHSIDACFSKVKDRLGSLDAMVSAVYTPGNQTIDECTPESLNENFAGHVTGSFLLARKSAELMTNGGSIVLFSSMYGQVAPDPAAYPDGMKPNPIAYGMCKAAINQMIRYLAVAWGPRGIRVNGVAPGPFPNPRVRDESPEFVTQLNRRVPMKRTGSREEMLGSVIYLVSGESSFTNGHILNVDGGWTAW